MIKNPFKKNKEKSSPGVSFYFEKSQTTLRLERQSWFECDNIWAKTVEELRKALGAIIKSETVTVSNQVSYESYNEFGQYNGQKTKNEAVETGKLQCNFSDNFIENFNDYIVEVVGIANADNFCTNSGGNGGSGKVAINYIDTGKPASKEDWRKKQTIERQHNITKLRREKAEIIAGLLMKAKENSHGEVRECGYTVRSYFTYNNGIDCLEIVISKDRRSLRFSVPLLINAKEQSKNVMDELVKCIYKIECGLERDRKYNSSEPNSYMERYAQDLEVMYDEGY